MKKMLILSFMCIIGVSKVSVSKEIINVSNNDALVSAGDFIERLTNIQERKLPLQQEVKEYIAGSLVNELLLAAYGRIKGIDEKNIEDKVEQQVKALSQDELDQFYKLRNKEKWRESWLDEREITKEDEMYIVQVTGLKDYEKSIARNLLTAREKNKLVQEARKNFEIHFEPNLGQVLADEIKTNRLKNNEQEQ